MNDQPAGVTLGARFAAARKLLGWSLRDAERASGVPNAHISQVETGAIAQPRAGLVARLAAAYGMDDLLVAVPRAAVEAAQDADPDPLHHVSSGRMLAMLEAAAPHIAEAAQEKTVTVAVAAERERIRQLAIEREAHYHACGVPCSAEHSERPFADLLEPAP